VGGSVGSHLRTGNVNALDHLWEITRTSGEKKKRGESQTTINRRECFKDLSGGTPKTILRGKGGLRLEKHWGERKCPRQKVRD